MVGDRGGERRDLQLIIWNDRLSSRIIRLIKRDDKEILLTEFSLLNRNRSRRKGIVEAYFWKSRYLFAWLLDDKV